MDREEFRKEIQAWKVEIKTNMASLEGQLKDNEEELNNVKESYVGLKEEMSNEVESLRKQIYSLSCQETRVNRDTVNHMVELPILSSFSTMKRFIQAIKFVSEDLSVDTRRRHIINQMISTHPELIDQCKNQTKLDNLFDYLENHPAE